MLTRENLKSQFHYDPDTGEFTRTVNSGGRLSGTKAGNLSDGGYIRISVFNKSYRAHRLAWLYMTGEMPSMHIDHINGVRHDNRFSNLRVASNAQNMHNIGKYENNTSGYKGVSWHKAAQKWCAQIKVNGKRIYLGIYESAELAHKAYQDFALKVHGEFYRGETV